MNHKTYTHLPLLRPSVLFGVFDTLNVPSGIIAKYTGCTRQSVHRWRTDSNDAIRPAFTERLNEVAYRLLRAAKANKLPAPKDRRPSTAEWDIALDDASHTKKIGEMTAAELLPASWLAKLNINPDSPDVAQ
jgi:hypothetical protein